METHFDHRHCGRSRPITVQKAAKGAILLVLFASTATAIYMLAAG
jgi:hypothetical protein